MSRKVYEQERIFTLDQNLRVRAARRTNSPPPWRQRARRLSLPPQDRAEPPRDLYMRTRRLLMAALRVWELKNGIHEP